MKEQSEWGVGNRVNGELESDSKDDHQGFNREVWSTENSVFGFMLKLQGTPKV